LWNLIFNYRKINNKTPIKGSLTNRNLNSSTNENLEEEIIKDNEEGKIKLNSILLKYSYYLVKLSHNDEVPYSDFIRAYLKYSKALYINEKYDKCILILINLLDIFPVIPLDEIKFLTEVNKKNKISLINNFMNFDQILKFYSKIQVYKKCEDVFYENHIKKHNLFAEDFNAFGSNNKSKKDDENSSCEEYDENSSRSEMSKSISRYGNKYFDESFDMQDEMARKEINKENNLEGKIVENKNLMNEKKESQEVENSFENEKEFENKLDDSLNIELEKKKMKKNLNSNKKMNKGKTSKSDKIQEDNKTKKKLKGKSSTNDLKYKTEDHHHNDLKDNLIISNKNKCNKNYNSNIQEDNSKPLKLLDPNEELDKINLSNNRSTNKVKVNIDDYSLIGNRNKVLKIDQKNVLEEDNLEELYTDNLENEDDIYQEGNESRNKILDLNIKSLSKFEEYLDNNTENIELPSEENSTCKYPII